AAKTGEITSAINQSSNSMIGGLEERGYAMNAALEAISSRIVGDIGDRAQQAEQTLTTLTGRLDETMSIRINAIESRFQSAMLELGSIIEENSGSAATAIASAGNEALSSLSAR